MHTYLASKRNYALLILFVIFFLRYNMVNHLGKYNDVTYCLIKQTKNVDILEVNVYVGMISHTWTILCLP